MPGLTCPTLNMAPDAQAIAFIGIPYLSISLIVADKVTKMSGVELLGFDTSGDIELVMRIRGSTATIEVAAETARSAALKLGATALIAQIPAPSDDILTVTHSRNTIHPLLNAREQFLPTDFPKQKRTTDMSKQPAAIGILETHGFTALLQATDRMVKAANVTVVAKEKIGAGLVTIVIQGDVAAVAAAIEAGRDAVGDLGKVIAAHVIPRPHEEVLALLGR
jgi:microcompartment protein CcmL/EutN